MIGDLWIELMSLHATLDPRFGLPLRGRTHYVKHAGQALRDRSYRLIVADHPSGLLGYVLGYIAENPPILPNARYGFIADLFVTPTVRRQGVGRALVRDMCVWFQDHGLTYFQVNVAHHNPQSQAFWRRIGCTDYLDHLWKSLETFDDTCR